MLDVAIRKADGTTAVDWSHVGVRTAPPLPVAPALQTILPDGLRRGSTVSVTGSMSLLLAVLGAASAGGAWCAFVNFGPRHDPGGHDSGTTHGGISAEAADEYGIDLRRVALVPAPGPGWTTAVGALLDALDIVVVRPPQHPQRVVPGDVRRLAARARSKDAVLMPYLTRVKEAAGVRGTGGAGGAGGAGDAGDADGEWPGADVRLQARPLGWSGLADGTGRLRSRRVEVTAGGRGPAARPRSTLLWLPADGGGVDPVATGPVAPLVPVVDLAG